MCSKSKVESKESTVTRGHFGQAKFDLTKYDLNSRQIKQNGHQCKGKIILEEFPYYPEGIQN